MNSAPIQQDVTMGKITHRTQSKNQQAIMNGDFFAAFLEMITQGGEEGETDLISQLPMQNTEEDPNAAMEMMANLLNGNAGFEWLMNSHSQSDAETANLQSNVQILQEMLGKDGAGSNLSLSQLQTLVSSDLQTVLQKMKQSDELGFGKQAFSFDDGIKMPAELAITSVNEKGTTGTSQQLFDGNMNFQNAIMQAQKLMKGQSKESLSLSDDPTELSFEQAIGQNKFETILGDKQVTTATQTTVDIADLAEQVKNGVSNGALGQQKEFTVKLKPEGLGEVTIKLIENQNKMTVSIVTATSEAAKLLNNELSSLRETMRALQIEVRDVLVQPEMDFSSMQQNLQQHMFQGQSHQSGENRNSNGYFSEFEDGDELETSIQPHLADEKMNIYI